MILRMLELFISHLDYFLRNLPLAYRQTYLEPLRFSSCRCWLFDLSILEWSRIPGWQKLRTVWNSLVLVVTPLTMGSKDQKLSPGAGFHHGSGWIVMILSTSMSLKKENPLSKLPRQLVEINPSCRSKSPKWFVLDHKAPINIVYI